MNSCGIDATYRVNVSLNDRRSSCDATISDIDDVTCTSTSSMTLTLYQCPSRHAVLGQYSPMHRLHTPLHFATWVYTQSHFEVQPAATFRPVDKKGSERSDAPLLPRR